MIEIKVKGPSTLEGIVSHQEALFPLDRKDIWIGRGEELAEKHSPSNYILNLAGISQAVSRLHACLSLSPAFFYPQQPYPSFITRICYCSSLPGHLLSLIWHFIQSPRKIILRDLHSKTGLFRKIHSCSISAGMQVVLGDSRPLLFHNQEIYDTSVQLGARLRELINQGYAVLNPGEGAASFWVLSFKGHCFILLDLPGRVLIGRSSDCHLAIAQASISRKHAHLDYIGSQWHLGDGDGTTASSNGVWVRTKRLQIQYRKADLQIDEGEKVAKVGDVLLTFSIKEEHSLLGVECMSFNKSTDGSFDQLLRKELEWKAPEELNLLPPELIQQDQHNF